MKREDPIALSELFVLEVLGRYGPMTTRELEARLDRLLRRRRAAAAPFTLGVHRSLEHLLAELSAAGAVALQPAPGGDSAQVQLTAHGQRWLAKRAPSDLRTRLGFN